MFSRLHEITRVVSKTRWLRTQCRRLTLDCHEPIDDRPRWRSLKKSLPITQCGTAQSGLVQGVLGLHDASTSVSHVKDAVFVCIDCEAYEQAQHIITEIGVAILDTRPLKPNLGAEELTAQIKAGHFRPIEHVELVNRRWVKGREEYFNFGTTTFFRYEDFGPLLRRLFAHPTRLDEITRFDLCLPTGIRNVIFVAHNIRADVGFMSSLGFSVEDVENIVDSIDTDGAAKLGGMQHVGLRRLLYGLGINATNLHNAGNDAFYTLQALLTMAVRDHAEPGSVGKMIEGLIDQKMPHPVYDDNKGDTRQGGVRNCPIKLPMTLLSSGRHR